MRIGHTVYFRVFPTSNVIDRAVYSAFVVKVVQECSGGFPDLVTHG